MSHGGNHCGDTTTRTKGQTMHTLNETLKTFHTEDVSEEETKPMEEIYLCKKKRRCEDNTETHKNSQ